MERPQQLGSVEEPEEKQPPPIEEKSVFYHGLYAPSDFDVMAVLV